MRISYISNPIRFFIIFTACLSCISSNYGIPSNNHSSILSLKLDKLPKDDEVLKLFQQWKKEMGREYNDLDEMAKRFKIFVSTLKYIVEANAKRESPHSAVLGLTIFADWSSVEFKKTYLSMNTEKHHDVVELTCIAIKTKTLQDLSVQEVLDCTPGPNNCTSGRTTDGFEWVIRNKGVALESDYPYTEVKGVCKASQIPNSPISAIHSFKSVPQSEQGLLCAVADQPISVGFCVTKDFEYHTGEIYEGPHCSDDPEKVNHSMLIVGYDSLDGEDYWIIKNSWGINWGINGYAYVKRNTGK
ncbi:hypothetical protein RYX36_001195, partial [Vicia faba]